MKTTCITEERDIKEIVELLKRALQHMQHSEAIDSVSGFLMTGFIPSLYDINNILRERGGASEFIDRYAMHSLASLGSERSSASSLDPYTGSLSWCRDGLVRYIPEP